MNLLPASCIIRYNRSEKAALLEKELSILQETPSHVLELKDALMFSCLTGLRKSDLLSLTAKDHHGNRRHLLYSQNHAKKAAPSIYPTISGSPSHPEARRRLLVAT